MNKEPLDDYFRDEAERWEAVARYVTGESTPEESDRIRHWLTADPGRAELIAALDRALQRLPTPTTTDLNVEAALQRVKARFDEPKVYELGSIKSIPAEPFRRPWSRTLVRAAAAVIVVLGASLVWRAAQPRETPLVATATFTTGVGQTDSLRLPDGTRVVLGPLSRLALAESYGGSARSVELNGEALFDVEHDAARPFSVRAANATIRDLGTRFTVRNSARDDVRVAVTIGSVILHVTSEPEKQGVVLSAGDAGMMDATGQVVALRGGVTADDVAFTEGRLVFVDATLDQVATELRRWYGIELRTADAGLANRHLTAAFDRDSLEQVLNVIGLALGASIERKGDTAFVRISR
jgi:transmembrane sensor